MADRTDMPGLPITTLRIPPDERRALEEMALALGYTQPRGPGAGRIGNISAFIRAIARGRYRLIKVDDSSDSDVQVQAERDMDQRRTE